MKTLPILIITVCSLMLSLPLVLADEVQPEAPAEENLEKSPAKWDVVVLKNGNRIKGLIVEENENKTFVDCPSVRKHRFYTAGINKNDIARILRLSSRQRESVRRQRQAQENTERAAQAAAATRLQRSAQINVPYALPKTAGAAPFLGGARAAGLGGGLGGGMGGGGYGGGAMAGMGGIGGMGGGMGGMGGGVGGMGGGMGGMGGGMGGMGGGMGGGGVIFTNIMQLFVPVNHALVGEVEPVIGLSGRTFGARR